jgi:hypothetical protein
MNENKEDDKRNAEPKILLRKSNFNTYFQTKYFFLFKNFPLILTLTLLAILSS